MKLAILTTLFVATAAPALAWDQDPHCANFGETEISVINRWGNPERRCVTKPGFQCPTHSEFVLSKWSPSLDRTEIRCGMVAELHTQRSVIYIPGKCDVIPAGHASYMRVSNKERIEERGVALSCWNQNYYQPNNPQECVVKCEGRP